MNKFELVGNPSLMGSGGNGAAEAKTEEIMAYLINRNTPKKAVGEKGYPRCPACNESLIGEYCYKCGQRTY